MQGVTDMLSVYQYASDTGMADILKYSCFLGLYERD